MGRPIARVTDRTIGTCYCHFIPIRVGGQIETGSPKSDCCGQQIARLGDVVRADCGHTGIINLASTVADAEGRGIARVGDTFTGCYVGYIIQGCPKADSD